MGCVTQNNALRSIISDERVSGGIIHHPDTEKLKKWSVVKKGEIIFFNLGYICSIKQNFFSMKINDIKNKEQMDEAAAKTKTFSQAVRLKCLDCSAYELSEVRNCVVTTCPLWRYRMGKRPKQQNGE